MRIVVCSGERREEGMDDGLDESPRLGIYRMVGREEEGEGLWMLYFVSDEQLRGSVVQNGGWSLKD
jgi:hypothetical protein